MDRRTNDLDETLNQSAPFASIILGLGLAVVLALFAGVARQ